MIILCSVLTIMRLVLFPISLLFIIPESNAEGQIVG